MSIYLDNHATTQLDKRVFNKMLPWFVSSFGNAASVNHIHGSRAYNAVEQARFEVSSLLSVYPDEIYFTSGATESNNIVLQGILDVDVIITTPFEHKSVLNVCKNIQTDDTVIVEFVDLTHDGNVVLDSLKKLLKRYKDKKILVSIIAANNEVGVIQFFEEIIELVKKYKVYIHTDATQAVGKYPISLREFDFASISAHKFHGPMGIGALYIRKGLEKKISSIMIGGGQEHGISPGTLNVPAIVGFGKSCEIARDESYDSEIFRLREKMETLLYENLGDINIHSEEVRRLSGNINFSIPCRNMEMFIRLISPHVSLSFGSACSTSGTRKSHVLKALGYDEDEMNRSVRVCIGKYNTDTDIENAVGYIKKFVDIANTMEVVK